MPRNTVKRSYAPSRTTPSGRKPPRSYIPPMNKPKPRSEILDYVEREREKRPDVSTLILVREFRGGAR
jgi:hypothetical protein